MAGSGCNIKSLINMEQIPYFLIVRLLLGLGAGIWLARKARSLIRRLAIGLMPMRYRVSEQSFLLQTRLSTALGFLVAIGLMLAIVLGLGKAENAARQHPWIKKEETTYASSGPAEQSMQILATETPAPEAEQRPAESRAPEVAPAPPPESERPAAYELAGGHYVQIFAFQQEDRAWVQQRYWETRLNQPVWVAIAPGDAVPYKVLIGPFRHRQDARSFLRSQKLPGFPREDKGLRLYKD